MKNRSVFWFRWIFGTSAGFGFSAVAQAGQTDLPGPVGSNAFGELIKLLPNGNVVVVDQYFSVPGGTAQVGAVYLYAANGNLISRLTGSKSGDRAGHGGITVLANGNFVVVSSRWDNGAVADAGAVTWISGTTGLNGEISAANSMVGSRAGDFVGDSAIRGQGGVTALSNGHYVVASPVWDAPPAAGSTASSISNAGAVTWGNGITGTVGVVGPGNSLVGGFLSDSVGIGNGGGGVVEVGNGNYVVLSPLWRNGSAASAGAVTWCNGTTGRAGAVGLDNSLAGLSANDRVGGSPGGKSITVLSNGHYVVASPWWKNGAAASAGAVTWCRGDAGRTGAISTANSLTGSQADDFVGSLVSAAVVPPVTGVTALANGNYVVGSPLWDKGAIPNAGAVTWVDGSTGATGEVSETNSLTGTTASDGAGRVTALPGGKYVVVAAGWDDGATANVGAVRLMEGNTAASGTFSAANSLVGTKVNDAVGTRGITVLTNGNFVVNSGRWGRGAVANAGAVTWVNATVGMTGPVTEANSLVGPQAGDFVGLLSQGSGLSGVIALNNGNYVVASPLWANGALTAAGAVTWGDGTTGTTGMVNASNSVTGALASDYLGFIPGESAAEARVGVTALANGNYVISAPLLNQGGLTDIGGVIWGNGRGPSSFTASPANTLFGTFALQRLGEVPPVALANGDFALPIPSWKNGNLLYAGALRLAKGDEPLLTPVDSTNSSIGNVAGTPARVLIFTASLDGTRVYVGWPDEDRVSILSPTAPNRPQIQVRRPSGLAVAPAGTVAVGEAALTARRILNLEITNVGYENLTLQDPGSDNGQFSLALPAGTTTLPPGGKILLTVTFTPASTGTQSSLVRFTTNDPEAAVFEITVTGEGVPADGLRTFDLSGHARSGRFGTHVVYLPNGNLVVTDPLYDAPGPAEDAGAAYLFSPAGGLISLLTGSTAGDQVGLNGVKVLANGNYLICSSRWNNNGAAFCGAVTWGSATAGVSGVVSPANSLTGSSVGDDVGGWQEKPGEGMVYALAGGNYVVGSPRWSDGTATASTTGAATWGNGTTGVSGIVSAANSLIGQGIAGVARRGIHPLPNGNYLVGSLAIPGGASGVSGAVTLGKRDSGITGIVSSANSLVGLGLREAVPLPDGSVVLTDPLFENAGGQRTGAVLWMDGSTAPLGFFDPSQALTGAADGDWAGQGGVIDMGGGRYAVLSPDWNGGRGAVTWCQSGSLTSGVVSSGNSLTGSSPGDRMGETDSVKAGPGYAVSVNPRWNNGSALAAGAVTWIPLDAAPTGAVHEGNSLVGTTSDDRVGSSGLTFLGDGNFVVCSGNWSGQFAREGAVTWVSGTTGRHGRVTAENSLTGGSPGSAAGSGGSLALGGTRYVIHSPRWGRSGTVNAGAVTWMDSPTDGRGVVYSGNSITGSAASDSIGSSGITVLANGHYVISSPSWNGGRGGVTWGDGYRVTAATVSPANSLTGSTPADAVGGSASSTSGGGVMALANGHYVVLSPTWDNGTGVDAGAISWGNGQLGLRGAVSSLNSLVRAVNSTNPGWGSGSFLGGPDGAFSVRTPSTLITPTTVSLGNGWAPLTGMPNTGQMVSGESVAGLNLISRDYYPSRREWAIGFPADNVVRLVSFQTTDAPQLTAEQGSGIDFPAGSTLDFGEVTPGASSERSLIVRNRGGASLQVGTPVSSSGNFTVQGPGAAPVLASGESTTVVLRFIPPQSGPFMAVLELASNDPAPSSFLINLRGTGAPLPSLPFGPNPPSPQLSVLTTGETQLVFQGIPGRRYGLERGTDLMTWPFVRQITAGPDGSIRFLDIESVGTKAYYRLRAY